jgi:predicted nucleic acid-binding protein
MIFIALAKVDGFEIITEDERMYKEALLVWA